MGANPTHFGTTNRVVAELERTIARTLYETDEDITDESIAALTARGDFSWKEARSPRISWEDTDRDLQSAYRRRARAVIALLQFTTQSEH